MERTTPTNRIGTEPHTETQMHRETTTTTREGRPINTRHERNEGISAQVPKGSLPILLGAVAAGFVLKQIFGDSDLFGGSEEVERTTRGKRGRRAEEDLLLAWLNDAYAMERAQIPVLENHAKDARDYPKIRRKDLQHLEETRRHADMVKSCIERLGGKTSTSKNVLGSVIGNLASVSTGPFEDELVKNFLSDYATENLEIASYQTIITAAQEIGDRETARICKQILKDEQEMAGWLEDHLPMAVRETLHSH